MLMRAARRQETCVSHLPDTMDKSSADSYVTIGSGRPTSQFGWDQFEEASERFKSPGRKIQVRYVVAAVILLTNAAVHYANTTLYIASVEMVASDVLNRGLTDLRAKHMSNDPLAFGANAAMPGTCPLLAQVSPELSLLDQVNATIISAIERANLAKDSAKLEQQVNERLAAGDLVDWTINQRANVIVAHTLGGRLLAIPLGWAAMRIGRRPIGLLSVVSSALTTLLFPWLVSVAPYWCILIFKLVGGGLAYGLTSVAYPLIGVWFLVDEASAITGYFFITSSFGPALSNFASAQMLANQVSWQWCFYVSGCWLAVCSLLFYWLIEDSPERSSLVSAEELKVLEYSAAKVNTAKQEQQSILLPTDKCACETRAQIRGCPARRARRDPIWSHLFNNRTIWLCIGVNISFYWFSKTSTLWPTFLANIAHLDAAQIGYVTAAEGITYAAFGYLYTYLIRKQSVQRPFNMSLTAYRRYNQVIAVAVSSTVILLIILADCSFWALLTASLLKAVAFPFAVASSSQIVMDLSTEDSGLIYGYIYTLSPADIIGLPVSSAIIANVDEAFKFGTRTSWRQAWYVCLALKVVTSGLFIMFARAEPKSFSRAKSAGKCSSLAVRS